MSEEEIIDILQNIICDEVIGTYCIKIQEEIDCSENCKDDDCYLIKAVDGIIDLYKNLKAIEQEHQKINGELREEIKQLKEEYNIKILDNAGIYQLGFKDGQLNIKNKIKQKIKEMKKYAKLANDCIEEKIIIADSDSLNCGRKEAHNKDIEVLEGLLKE